MDKKLIEIIRKARRVVDELIPLLISIGTLATLIKLIVEEFS